jgi:hypothetical protein
MINWTSKNRFEIRGTRFRCMPLGLGQQQSTIEEFVFQKSGWMVERYSDLVKDLQPKNIFELGIWRGGSCVFFHQLSQAHKLVTVDLKEERVTALDQFINDRHLQDSLVPLYGVDQSDGELLESIRQENYESQRLDLVIDDASHFLDESRISFNTLFPWLRPGGAYIIEDWPWAHAIAGSDDDDPGFYPDREPLTKLVFELILACPSTESYIDKIEIDRNSATIWRGTAEIPAGEFAIEHCSLKRGRQLIAGNAEEVQP